LICAAIDRLSRWTNCRWKISSGGRCVICRLVAPAPGNWASRSVQWLF